MQHAERQRSNSSSSLRGGDESRMHNTRSRSCSHSRSRSRSPPHHYGDTATLCVRKITRTVTEAHLREIFGLFGPVKGVTILDSSGVSNSLAHVEMSSNAFAMTAIKHLDAAQVDGVRIQVTLAVRPAHQGAGASTHDQCPLPQRERSSQPSRWSASLPPSVQREDRRRARSPSAEESRRLAAHEQVDEFGRRVRSARGQDETHRSHPPQRSWADPHMSQSRHDSSTWMDHRSPPSRERTQLPARSDRTR